MRLQDIAFIALMAIMATTCILLDISPEFVIGNNYRNMLPKYIKPQGIINGSDVATVTTRQIITLNDNAPENRAFSTKYEQYSYISMFRTSLLCEVINFYHFRNVFIGKNEIMYDSRVIKLTINDLWYSKKPELVSPIIYENVIYLYHYINLFAHVLTDGSIPMLFHFPDEILNKSVIMIRCNVGYVQDYIREILGDNVQIVKMPKIMTFCENVYTMRSVGPTHGMLISSRKIKEVLYRKYNLLDVKPEIVLFANRLKHEYRYVENLRDLMDAAALKYPKLKFEFMGVDKVFTQHIAKVIRKLSTVKILVSGCGSTIFNCAFMHDDTGCLAIGSELHDWANYGLAHVYRIWLGITINPHIKHFGSHLNNSKIDIDYHIKFFDRIVYAVENQHWPEEMQKDSNITFYFNFTLTRKILKLKHDIVYDPYQSEAELYDCLLNNKTCSVSMRY